MKEEAVEKIYLDMDGVLADFDRGVRELCGLEPLDQTAATREQTDALFDAMKKVPHFYGRLEPMPGAVEMFNRLWEKYGDKVEILTGIPKPRREIADAAEDKVTWVRKYLSGDVVVHTVFREEKKDYCKGPGCILIDDFAKTISEWEKLGGTGVLFRTAEEISIIH